MTKQVLLTVEEAAEYLFGENDRANYVKTLRLIRTQNIHHIKIGRKILIHKDILEQVGKPNAL